MANRQTIPNSIFPVVGDVESTTGDPTLTVVGIQKTPFSSTPPVNGQVPVFDDTLDAWIPADPVVSGPDAPGSPSSANPVQVAGIDEGNTVRELRTDTYGSLRSLRIEQLLDGILNTNKAMLAAILALDNTLNDQDYQPDSFSTGAL